MSSSQSTTCGGYSSVSVVFLVPLLSISAWPFPKHPGLRWTSNGTSNRPAMTSPTRSMSRRYITIPGGLRGSRHPKRVLQTSRHILDNERISRSCLELHIHGSHLMWVCYYFISWLIPSTDWHKRSHSMDLVLTPPLFSMPSVLAASHQKTSMKVFTTIWAAYALVISSSPLQVSSQVTGYPSSSLTHGAANLFSSWASLSSLFSF